MKLQLLYFVVAVFELWASEFDFNSSCIIDLVKKTPAISDDLGRNAREMVSLRLLESLFVRENSDANSVASVPGDKVELDPSRDCEDVLRCILLEVISSVFYLYMVDYLIRLFESSMQGTYFKGMISFRVTSVLHMLSCVFACKCTGVCIKSKNSYSRYVKVGCSVVHYEKEIYLVKESLATSKLVVF